MAVKSYALTTPQRAADAIGLGTLTSGSSQEVLLERLIDSVTEYVENYIGFRVQETAYTNEEYDTEDGDTLNLKNYPINSSETFTLDRRNSLLDTDDWEAIDGDYYSVDFDNGIILGMGSWEFARTRAGYRVSYTAGFDFDNSTTFLADTEGGDIELAVWLLLGTVYNRVKGGAGIKSEAIGDYKVVYAVTMFENEDIKNLLDKYRRGDIDVGGYLTPLNS